jgi:hypothetical protein
MYKKELQTRQPVVYANFITHRCCTVPVLNYLHSSPLSPEQLR